MTSQDIPVLESDDRGVIYTCGPMHVLLRRKGSTSADHTHQDREVMYLVQGEIELTLGSETQRVVAPATITAEPNVYHKLIAHTDIILVYERTSGSAHAAPHRTADAMDEH